MNDSKIVMAQGHLDGRWIYSLHPLYQFLYKLGSTVTSIAERQHILNQKGWVYKSLLPLLLFYTTIYPSNRSVKMYITSSLIALALSSVLQISVAETAYFNLTSFGLFSGEERTLNSERSIGVYVTDSAAGNTTICGTQWIYPDKAPGHWVSVSHRASI